MELKEITENHPNYADYKQARETLRTEVEPQLDTWENMYAYLDNTAIDCHKALDPFNARATLSLYRAFTHTMRELPEEGDCTVIAARTMDVYIYRPDITLFDAIEHIRNLTNSLTTGILATALEALAAIAGNKAGDDAEPEEPPEAADMPVTPHNNRTLH